MAKHKSLLARCMDNIRGNKERIVVLTQERDLATQQLQDRLRDVEKIKVLEGVACLGFEHSYSRKSTLYFNIGSSFIVCLSPAGGPPDRDERAEDQHGVLCA